LIVLVVAGVIGSGVLRRRWMGSYDQAGLQAASERVHSIPLRCGEWDGNETELGAIADLPPEVFGTNAVRRYMNRDSGAFVTVLVACGPPGPMVVHDPMLCVAEGRNTSVVSGPARVSITAGTEISDFYVATFTREVGPTPVHFRIYWSWSGDGRWQAPETPRIDYAKYRWLNKVYVIRVLQRPDEPMDKDPCKDFLGAFLPSANAALFSPQ
jgi:hypothetical protein